MFVYFYQACLVIFLAQGILSPVLLVLSGVSWRRQSRKLERLQAEIETFRGKKINSDAGYESILRSLPRLKPLKCSNCAAGLLLRPTETFCPNCRARNDLPEDYAATVALKAQGGKLLKSAVRHWRAANILTHPLASWSFFLLIFIEPLVLFPTVVVGSNLYPDTWADRVFIALGETVAFVIMLLAFLGFINWTIIFILLTNLSKSLRLKLPLMPPADAPEEGDRREKETASCQACGGGIEYDGGDFACLCGYCNVVNFRVRFVRRARVDAEKQQTTTKSALFGAMEIIEDFIGSYFFLSLILGFASFLLVIIYAIQNAR